MSRISAQNQLNSTQPGRRRDGNFGRNSNSVSTGGDYTIEDFLGPMEGAVGKMRADDVLSHETFNQDKYYEGRSLHLTSILDFLILENADFWCREVLPWEATDELHIQWNVFKFDRTIADIEPHQGVPRLVTASQESRNASLIRRGLAFMIEHGFYNTERGRQHFMLNLKQITDAVHTTCYSDVLAALLRCNNYYVEWNKKYGVQGGGISDALSQERRRWSIVSKSERGMYLLDADLKADFAREGVKPTHWIFPPRMGIYMSMIPKSEVVYSEKGQQAAGNLEKDRYTVDTFRGCKVYEAIPFDIDFTGAPISLLERPRSIGEYFTIGFGETIHIYSADHDRFVPLSYSEVAKKAITHGGPQGPHLEDIANTIQAIEYAIGKRPLTGSGGNKVPKGSFAAQYPSLETAINSGLGGSATLDQVGADLLKLLADIRDANNSSYSREIVWFQKIGYDMLLKKMGGKESAHKAFAPSFVIFRPFQTWTMGSAILLKGGSELGATYHGHHDMQLQNDAVRKILVGHYTFYSRALVRQPKNVAVVEDVFATGYIGGEGNQFFDDKTFARHWQNGDIGTERCNLSLIAHATWTPVDELRETLKDGIDMLGSFSHHIRQHIQEPGRAGYYPGSKDLVGALSLDQLTDQRDAASENSFIRDFQSINTVCFRGMQYTKSPGDPKPKITSVGAGHWGSNVYAGVREHRTGRSGNGFVREKDYEVAF